MSQSNPENAGLHWVFGYGSLIWKQDFPFVRARPAFIDGWARRLWQGSHDHRGTPDDPGRVATLVAAPGERCYGRALLIEHDVFTHLDHREKNGYQRGELMLHFDDESVAGVTYFAGPDNHAYLGDAPITEMVTQIMRCAGDSGNNIDYVLELANALARHGIEDQHLSHIAAILKARLQAHDRAR